MNSETFRDNLVLEESLAALESSIPLAHLEVLALVVS